MPATMPRRMQSPAQDEVRNRLLSLMSPDDYALLRPNLLPCEAHKGDTLFARESPVDTIWFMDSGIGSLVTVSNEGQRVEGGIWGRDGFAPTAVALDVDASPFEGQVQLAGTCWRIAAHHLREALAASRDLHLMFLRYVQTLQSQVAYTALSNAVHTVDERLARWLLMCHDRIDGDELPLTHEFMAVMLAVRRPSVTTSLHVLEGNGFVRSERGCVVIRNRAAMEEFAADAYGAPEREYERLIGPLR